MSGKDDPLDSLLGSIRPPKRTITEDLSFLRAERSTEERGLNPLDMLALPQHQRDLVNFLSRRKQASLEQIGEKVKGTPEEIAENLAVLKDKGYIREALLDSIIHYRVVFRGKVSRSGRGVPQDIWDAVDLDNTVFLGQHALFSHLSEVQIKQIAAMMVSKRYRRNEVIIWQGDIGDSIYFIKMGIVGISRITPNTTTREAPIFAYLKQGDILAEHNLLGERQYAASATATALSEVDLLQIRRGDFLDFLLTFDDLALELARILSERLMVINNRLSSQGSETKLALLFGMDRCGTTTLGSTLALTLAKITKRKAVYTEHPEPDSLPDQFGFSPRREIFSHPAGYDVAAIAGAVGLPATVRTTLVMDRLFGEYPNIVIGLPNRVDESLAYMLEKANQVIVVVPPDVNAWGKTMKLMSVLKASIHPERTSLLLVVNHTQEVAREFPQAGNADFEIPFLSNLPLLKEQREDNLPDTLVNIAIQLADRLGRTNQIGIYIPTTSDTNRTVDTSGYVQETMTFLGNLFGGATATASEAHGVWNSEEVGLVSETIHIVRTYVTHAELDRYLGDVLEYVERLKDELKQEAMALEVNKKLMLI